MQKRGRPSGQGSSRKENDRSSSGKVASRMKKKKKDGEPQKAAKKVNGPRGQSQSCHQCRQSIFSNKGAMEARQGQLRVKCSNCTRYWCEKCLQNRYGLAMATLNRDQWKCAVCLRNCNCSLCRRKEGKLATGILTPLAKNAGFSNVSDFLDKGTDDIAKCLQWRSPDVTKTSKRAVSEPRKRYRRSSCANSDTLSDVLEERKENSDHTSNGKLLPPPARVSSPPPRRQDSVAAVTVAAGVGHVPKRRRITHPAYCITVVGDDDPIDQEWAGSSCRPEHKEQNGWDPVFEQMQNTPRRVLRSRVVPIRPASLPSISLKRRKMSIERESAPATCRLLVHEGDRQDVYTGWREPVAAETKRQELEQLKCARIAKRKEAEKVRKLVARNERMRERRASQRKRRLLKLEQAEEKRMKLKAAKEKLLKAKLLLRDAKKSQRATERERKKRELADLISRKKEERLRARQLSMAWRLAKEDVRKELVDDTPESCQQLGLPDLPALPCLEMQVLHSQIPAFLFSCEFLHLFSKILKIEHSIDSSTFTGLLQNSRTFISVCWSLLRAISDGDEELLSEATAASSLRKSEEFLYTFLNRGRQNGSVLKGGGTVAERVVVLEILCKQALESELVVRSIEVACKEAEELNRQARRETRSVVDQMKSELKRLCEERASVLEMEQARESYKKKLEALSTHHEKALEYCRLRTRLLPLGEDRYGRLFWQLESHPGSVLVEPGFLCHGDGEGKWAVIDSAQLHQKFVDSLFVSGRREGLLLNNLRKLTIASSSTP